MSSAEVRARFRRRSGWLSETSPFNINQFLGANRVHIAGRFQVFNLGRGLYEEALKREVARRAVAKQAAKKRRRKSGNLEAFRNVLHICLSVLPFTSVPSAIIQLCAAVLGTFCRGVGFLRRILMAGETRCFEFIAWPWT